MKKHNKILYICLGITIIGSILLSLVPPLILEQIIDELVGKRQIAISLAVFYFVMIVLSGLFDSGKAMCVTVFGQKITHTLRSRMCQKITRLPMDYFTKNEPGSITSRFVNDVDTVEVLFSDGVISMCVDICKVIGIIVVIFVKSKGLGIILLLVSPLLLGLTRFFQKQMLKAQKANRVAIGEVNQYIPETIENIRTIHCLGKESYMESQYDNKIQESYRAVEKTNLYDSIYSPIIIMISTCMIAALMIFSSMSGEMQEFFGMSVGSAVAVVAYVGKIFGPIESIGMEIQNIQSAVAGVHRIKEILNEEEQSEKDENITEEYLKKMREQGIQFSNVSFSYDGKHNILDQFYMEIKSGDRVTLTGRTGVGKSTIFKLILGLYQPEKGKVTVFGNEASTIPDSIKRRLFGYVEQSFHMVPGTVADQISLFDAHISMEDIQEAIRMVGLEKRIHELPEGYQTECDKAALSQGELQLLSIARAIVANPPIMLLDEITANMDSITENQVLTAIERAAEGRTVISISHRIHFQSNWNIKNIENVKNQ